ncbi:hypothetical protein D3C80_1627840 [compost metagenome]
MIRIDNYAVPHLNAVNVAADFYYGPNRLMTTNDTCNSIFFTGYDRQIRSANTCHLNPDFDLIRSCYLRLFPFAQLQLVAGCPY